MIASLTQGDRRATGSAQKLGLGEYDIDNMHGTNALTSMVHIFEECSLPPKSSLPVRKLPEQDAALVLARFDGIMEKLRLFAENNQVWSDEKCIDGCNAAIKNADESDGTSIADLRDFELMKRLIRTENGKKVALWRNSAINAGNSCSKISDEGYQKDKCGAFVQRQLSEGGKRGFVFPFHCHLLLHDVGLEPRELSFKGRNDEASKIPRFLNRVLGLRIACQDSITAFFYDTLSAIVKEAKRRGQYDLGIRTYSGRQISFEVCL